MQVSGFFYLDLLLAFCLWAVAFHVASFATQIALSTKPLSISSSSSTQLHGGILTITMLPTVVFMMMLGTSWNIVQWPLPRPSKLQSAVSAVSKSHGMTHITWVTQHYMVLYILLEPMQICQKQIVGTHEATNLQHNRPKLLIVMSNWGLLPQVKQVDLVVQGMVQVMEFSFQSLAEILPGTNPEFCPILICHWSPPGQGLPHQ